MLDPFPSLSGLHIIASEHMPTETVEDWSSVRSPGRAARRRCQGHRQRIVYRQVPKRIIMHDKVRNALFMHPAIFEEVSAALGRGVPADEAIRSVWGHNPAAAGS